MNVLSEFLIIALSAAVLQNAVFTRGLGSSRDTLMMGAPRRIFAFGAALTFITVVSAALAAMPLAVSAPDLSASLGRSLSGAVVVVALLAVAASLSRRIHGRDGVGAGDIKLLGALGLWAGPVGGLAVVGGSCLLALAGRAAVLRVRKSALPRRLHADGTGDFCGGTSYLCHGAMGLVSRPYARKPAGAMNYISAKAMGVT